MNAIGWLGAAYPWMKALHVVFVIFWMAGLFMLPRFFVYHQEDAGAEAQWIEREARLIRIILNPALIASWAFGLALIVNIGEAGAAWFHAKFGVVLVLTAYHFWMVRYHERLATGGARLSGRTLRLINEVPGLAAIAIVVLVIVRPF